MDNKLCRICGKQDDNYVRIFKTEGLRNKIETCLPIVITQQYPLPDIICNLCLDSVDNFYSFIKNCLQNIIVLEAQYDIIESCLKTKRKVDKSVLISDSDFTSDTIDITLNKSDYVSLNTVKNELSTTKDSVIPNFSCGLVDYDSSDDESDENDFVIKTEPADTNPENNIIKEIVQRKYLKRKIDDTTSSTSKISKLEDSSSRRKNKQPKRIEYHLESQQPKIETIIAPMIQNYTSDNDISEQLLNLPADISITREEVPNVVPAIQEPMQTCLLCEQQFFGPIPLTAHMYEIHGIDLAQVFAATQPSILPPILNVQAPVPTPAEKPQKKKIPNLVKISDVLNVRKQLPQENYDDPPLLEPQEKIVPPVSVLNKTHYTCPECDNLHVYKSFKEYSNHRRSQHQIFHCDLCPKFYGRNSHLWKHVNRVHKGHPSITCQLCYKTSASKYHLAQHFNKMHSVKPQKPKLPAKGNSGYGTPEENDEEFMNQKFQGFDFKSVRQSFLRQDLLEKQKYVSILKKNDDDPKDENNTINEIKKEDVSDNDRDNKNKDEIKHAPKEIDSSSNLYTNIITNYTPPTNEGAFKCPKCFKGFHKKNLLKKHKKNCRPRLQKDLLTRCKTCSRIFKDRQSLAKHLINYHSEYTCEICYLAVQSKCEIVSHIRFSHPNSELTCHCGQILRSKSDLQKHKSDHRDSHVCQFCGDMLPTKIKLKMHILSLHRKILSLSCGICLKLFETQHILRDHVRLVHGDQLSPLTSCTVCGKNYGSKWKTYDHLNKSHGRIFKACKACLEVFETEEDLQKHFENDHLNSKTTNEKKVTVEKKEFQTDNNYHLQDFIRGGGNSSSDSDDETSGESSGMQNSKTLQDDIDYRNYIIKEFQSNLDKKSVGQNGLDPTSKKSDLQKYQENKLSLLEKRLLGKKVTENEVKTPKNKKHTEMGYHRRKKDRDSRYDEDIIHNSSKRTVYVNSNDPSLCEICLKVWPAKKHLWQHYIRCHKLVAATVCGICLKTNPSYSSLQTHLRETHPNLLYGCGFGSNFICRICGRYHNASSKLKLHMAIHLGIIEHLPDEFKEMCNVQTMSKEMDEESSGSEPKIDSNDIKREIKEEQIDQNDDQMDDQMDDQDDQDDQMDDQIDQMEDQIDQMDDRIDQMDENIDQMDDQIDNPDQNEEQNDEQDEMDDMNYESLIEEVEVSSESENEYEKYNETEYNQNEYIDHNYGREYTVEAKQENQSEHEDTTSDDDCSDGDDTENEGTENELEQEMLKNMIGEGVTIVNEIKAELSNDESQNSGYQSIEFIQDYDDKVKIEVSHDDWTNASNFILKNIKRDIDCTDDNSIILYERKEIELDNAIKSIAFNDDADTGDYSNSGLNESELETAVGSIL